MLHVSEHLDTAQLRQADYWINDKLKRGKAFESSTINGLLVVSLEPTKSFAATAAATTA